MVLTYLDAGAELELEGGELGTPFMAACDAGRLEAVKLMVRRGAAISDVNKNGKVVSGLVAARHHPSMIQRLLVSRFTE
jgi:ankyrin repeat protein